MKGAGLTHGGFYGHFDSKDDLTAEVTSRVLGDEGWIEDRTGAGTLSLEDLVRRYLSRSHRDDAGHVRGVDAARTQVGAVDGGLALHRGEHAPLAFARQRPARQRFEPGRGAVGGGVVLRVSQHGRRDRPRHQTRQPRRRTRC